MQDFSTLIQSWYRLNARDLPWRRTKNPYAIWLSEIILQQTRVDQGMAYYLKFMDHYPTVERLASAQEDDVLNDWQGLGYYSRARNLHSAAKYIVEVHKGEFPRDYKEVLALKGVGEYTAAAISSFAHNDAYAVVDGNVYRVLSRYLGIDTPIDSTQGKKEFKEAAQGLLDKENPADHNQAIMELGALVCSPKKPDCENCPVQESCSAFASNNQLKLPVKSKKTKVRDRYLNYIITHKEEYILVKKRGDKDIWKGLYDFPLIETDKNVSIIEEQAAEYGFGSLDLDAEHKHILSHQRLHAKFWLSEVIDESKLEEEFIRIKTNELEDYPMPQLLIRYLSGSKVFGGD
jgi:A/G-specific adenine glycosylase